MENEVEIFPVSRVTRDGRNNVDEEIAIETPVTIILNDQELVTMLCSPTNLDFMAVGFLSSEGFLKSKNDIKNVLVDHDRGVVRVETIAAPEFEKDVLFKRIISSGCGRGASFYSAADAFNQKVESGTTITPNDIFRMVNDFQHGSELYLATHAVHSAALCEAGNILYFSEDIGRHNAIDKLFGKCLIEDIPTEGKIIITSGRVTSEILHKVAKKGIPIIVSVSVPTNLGIKIADGLGITLAGSVKGGKINVYTNGWRVI